MAICNLCGRDTADAASCVKGRVEIDGDFYDAIPFPITRTGRCSVCGVLPGGFHHLHCQQEECPKCGGQFVSCGCAG